MKPLDEYPHTQPDRCNACGEEIVWVQGASGVCIPVNPEPTRDGELTIIAGLVQPPLTDVLGLVLGTDCRYVQHLRTCPELRSQEAIQERIKQAMSKAPHPHEVKQCQCGASMFFAPSAKGNGKNLPLCEVPNPMGNVFLNEKHEAVHVSKANPAPDGATLYMSHFADCPARDQFRTPK